MSDASDISDDEGYDGPADRPSRRRIVRGVRTAGRRVRPDRRELPLVRPRVGRSATSTPLAGKRVSLRTPHGVVDTALADLDPWGRARVEGFGTAPFEVATSLP